MPEWRNWYTRTTQNRFPQGLRVQVPPPAQIIYPLYDISHMIYTFFI